MKLLGYAPDVDQTVEGAIIDCTAFVPTEKGFCAAPDAVDAGQPALAAECRGATYTRDLDDSFRIFAGTSTALYELSGGSWVDRTRSVGGAYTLGTDDVWRFAQFGNITLATNGTDTLQYSDTAAFADITGAPEAAIVETVLNQVFVADTYDAGFGISPNRWWFSAIGDYTDWTPDVTTGCVSGILTSTPGKITGAKRLGDQIVVYKERAMYVGSYVGGDVVWAFREVIGEAGCSSQEAIVNIGTPENPVHLFMGADDFWRFDGARPIPVGSVVRKTVYAELDRNYAHKIKTLHDRVNSRVYFYYPSRSSSGTINKCVVYHYRKNEWGRDDRTVEACMDYITGGVTYATASTVASTYASIPSTITYSSASLTSGEISPCFFDSSHAIYTLTGTPANSSFTMNDMGDDTNYYLLSRVKPVWLQSPLTASMTNYYKYNEGDSLTTGVTTTMGNSRFDLLRSARWHRLKFDMTGNYIVANINVVMNGASIE